MAAQPIERFDVLIVGAGISGVGAAYHLMHQCRGTSFVVLEEQESFGGTGRTGHQPRPSIVISRTPTWA
jgi:cation diffusion facilitator CzcD-associated flavoprotein CzcO